MKVSVLITLMFSLIPLIVSGWSLLSKNHFESVFLTDDQILKKRFFSLGGSAFSLTYILTLVYILWKKFVSETINMPDTIFISISIFMIILIFTISFRKLTTNFLIKNKTMLKVSIESLGEVYIIKMFDPTTCICSQDAHVDLNDSNHPKYFVRIEDLIKLPITKEIVALPSRSIRQKLFD